MLQSIRDKSQSWIAKVIVGFIIITFAFWGVESIVSLSVGSGDVAASVNGEEITKQQLARTVALQKQGPLGQLPDSLLQSYVLEQLIQQELLKQLADDNKIFISDDKLNREIVKSAKFQDENGKFSEELFLRYVSGIGLTPYEFKDALRVQMQNAQIQQGILRSEFVLENEAKQLFNLVYQTRDVEYAFVSINDLQDTIQVTDDEIKNYYDQHPDQFMSSEKVSVDYIELNREVIAKNETVSPQEVQAKYDELLKNLNDPNNEQRHASHILIQINNNVTEAQALAKITELAKRIENGEAFEEVAKLSSEDKATAARGGDLGFLKRDDAPDSEFANVLFQLSVNEVSKPVKTTYGYHLLKLLGVNKPDIPEFNAIKEKLEQEIKKEKSSTAFMSIAEKLSDLVFSSGDLDSAAKELNLAIQSTALFDKDSGEGIAKNPKVREAAFAENVLNQQENSSVIEIDPDHLVVIHLKEHQPSVLKAFDIVKEEISQKIIAKKKSELLHQQVAEFLKKLNSSAEPTSISFNDRALDWQHHDKIKRTDQVNPEVLALLFNLPKTGQQFFSATLADGREVIYRLKAVNEDPLQVAQSSELTAFKSSLNDERASYMYDNLLFNAHEEAEVRILIKKNEEPTE